MLRKCIYLAFWVVLIGVMVGCEDNQEETDAKGLKVLIEDGFDSLDGSRWSVSEQSLDDSATPTAGLSLSTVTPITTTHITEHGQACFTANNVVIQNEALQLKTQVQELLCPDTSHALQYGGAEVVLAETRLYGKFSIELKTSLVAGTLSSFYLRGTDMEMGFHWLGSDNSSVMISFENGENSHIETLHPETDFEGFNDDPFSGFDTSSEFHTYQLSWQEGIMQWSIDGQGVFSLTSEVPSEALTLVLSTAVNTTDGDLSSDFSSALSEIDSFEMEGFE